MKLDAPAKLLTSSTFWCSLILPALNLVATALGYPIPWDVVLAGVGAYGVKEAAGKLKAAPSPGSQN
jgi:hypothetical protein